MYTIFMFYVSPIPPLPHTKARLPFKMAQRTIIVWFIDLPLKTLVCTVFLIITGLDALLECQYFYFY
jgi:hypothetical protein